MGTPRDIESGRVDALGRAIKVSRSKAAHPANHNRTTPSVNDELRNMGQDPVSDDDIIEKKIDMKSEEIIDRLDGMSGNDSFRFEDGVRRYSQLSVEDIADQYAIAVDGEGEDSDYTVVMQLDSTDEDIASANERTMKLDDPSSLPGDWAYDSHKKELVVPIKSLPRSDQRNEREQELIESFAYLGEEGPLLDDSEFT